MARLFTMIGMFEAVMPSIAPYLGSIAAQDWGWRINFLIIAGLACAMIVSLMAGKIQQQHALHETLLAGFKEYFAPMKSWRFVLLVSAAGFGFGGYITYLSLTPDLYQRVLQYSMLEFGRISFFTTLTLLSGALCNMFLLKYVRIAKIVSYATLPMLVGSLGLLLSILFVAKLSLWAILIPGAIFIVGQYFVLLNCIACGAEFVEERDQANAAGAATFMLLLIASVVGTLASLIPLESEWVLAAVLLACAVVASIFIAMSRYAFISAR
jgi:DHA1 family bicyclomycin/chloramphenicol resistance-like MFS transporter